jgi:hypothetical protein
MLSDVVEEFRGAKFGDARLAARLNKSVQRLAEDPSRPYPHAMMTGGDTEGLYRFFRNPKVTTSGILAPHIDRTVERARQAGSVVCIHDTTEVALSSEAVGGFYQLSTKSYGYTAHVSLAVRESDEIPLGLLGMTVPKRGEPRKAMGKRRTWSDPDKETRRWYEQAQSVEKSAGTDVEVIHVMDREADSYEIFHGLAESRHVIRLSKSRRAATDTTLSDELENADVVLEREVQLGPRSHKKTKSGQKIPPKSLKAFPKRTPRKAKLAARAVAGIAVLRPHHIPASANLPESILQNVVEVREIDPPQGAEPVHWMLWTTEAVDTPEAVARVIDLYRLRWVIEEFFCALKTGCALNDRKPESLHTATNGFALLAVMAWHLILLRQMERASATAPATVALSKDRIRLLRRMTPKGTLPPNPRVRHVVAAFARLGGHMKSNGPPGWKVLGRGFRDFLRAEQLQRAVA